MSSSFSRAWEASGRHCPETGRGPGTPGPGGGHGAACRPGPAASGAEISELSGCSHQAAQRALCPAPQHPQTQARGEPSYQATRVPRFSQALCLVLDVRWSLTLTSVPQFLHRETDGDITAVRFRRLSELVCVQASKGTPTGVLLLGLLPTGSWWAVDRRRGWAGTLATGEGAQGRSQTR